MAITWTQSGTRVSDTSGSGTPVASALSATASGALLVSLDTGYNPAILGTGSRVSDNQSNSYTRAAEIQVGGDPIVAAAYYKLNATAGVTAVTMSPQNATFTSTVAAEFAVAASTTADTPATASANSSTMALSGVTPSTTDNVGIAVFTWYSDADPGTPAGWTLIAKQTNFTGLAATIAAYYKIQSAGTAFSISASIGSAADWSGVLMSFSAPVSGAASGVGAAAGTSTASGIGASTAASVGSASGTSTASAIAAGVSAAVGTASGVGAASGVGRSLAASVGSAVGVGIASGISGTPNIVVGIADNQANQTLSFGSYVPPLGYQITALMSLFSKDPVDGMFSDNNSNTWEGPDVIDPLSDPGGDVEDGIVAALSARVGSHTTTPFTVTFDPASPTPGDLPGRYWTWAIMSHPAAAKPNVFSTDTDANSNAAHAEAIPKIAGALSVATPAGSWIAFWLSMNRGHEAQIRFNVPVGWTAIVTNTEDSAHQSGIFCYQQGSGVVTLEPQALLTNPGTGLPQETTGYRTAIVVYSLAGSVSAVGTAAGTSAAIGIGASKIASVGSAAGTSTANGVGLGTAAGAAVGAASGTSTAVGIGASVARSVGSAAGIGLADGRSASLAAAIGLAEGTSTATAVGQGQIIIPSTNNDAYLYPPITPHPLTTRVDPFSQTP